MKRINCHQVTMNKVTVNLIIEPNKVSHWYQYWHLLYTKFIIFRHFSDIIDDTVFHHQYIVLPCIIMQKS